MEAELIAARLFRYRVRRGLGVFYALIALMPTMGVALYLTVSTVLVVSGIVVGYLAVWFVSRLCGFSGLTRMQYSLDFLVGERGPTYDEEGYRLVSWSKSLLSFILIVLPWLGYSIATQEGYPGVAVLILLIPVATLIRSEISWRREGKNNARISILEKKVEDWIVIGGSLLIAILAILPGAPVWTWVLASPIFLLAGVKSLYDAPKELTLVAY